MEVVALAVSVLSVLLAGVARLKTESRWRAERARQVRVVARHDGMGIDINADREELEHVIAVHVYNLGERFEHVMEIGLQSTSGELLVNDRPWSRRDEGLQWEALLNSLDCFHAHGGDAGIDWRPS